MIDLTNALRETVTLEIPREIYEDGCATGCDSYPARALITEFSERDQREFGRCNDGKIFLIAADPPVVPPVHAQIVHAGRRYDIRSVRVCRNLDGAIVAVRCAVL